MSIKKRIPAGVLDSGFASLATFAVGLYAVRYLTASELGVYSLYLSAFLLATVVPTSLTFTAVQVRLLNLPVAQRLRADRQSLMVGLLPCVLAALLVGVALPQAMSAGHRDLILPMTVTAFLAAALSPMQDQIRDLLHLGDASWGAAAVSATQAVVATATIGVALLVDVDAAWIPFGALVTANSVSLLTGMAIAHVVGEAPPDSLFNFRQLSRSGTWFLASDVLTRIADFVARSAVVAVATTDVLGVAEGARIAARPLVVFVIGVSAVIVPQAMKAGQSGDRSAGRRIARLSNIGVLGLAAIYTLVGGIEWIGNPFSHLAPIGYTVAGLVPFTIAASAISGMLFAERGQLIGGGREKALTGVEVFAAASQVVSALTAGLIGPFAPPLGALTSSATRWVGYRIALARHYREFEPATVT